MATDAAATPSPPDAESRATQYSDSKSHKYW